MSGEIVVVPLHEKGVAAFTAADGTDAWQWKDPVDPAVSADDQRTYIVSRDAMHALDLTTGKVVWSVELGMLTAPPLVHAGWVVVATVGNLTALRASDGSQVWRQEIGTIEMQPAIDGDLLVVPLIEGSLVALTLQTGEQRWERVLGGAPGEPLVIGGQVYAGARDKVLYVLNADDGEVAWTLHVGAAPRGRPAVDADRVYGVALDNVLRTYDRDDGARGWWKGLRYRPASGPVLMGDAVIVPGAVSSLPVFARRGGEFTPLDFPATLVGVSNVAPGPFNRPRIAVVTGDLQHPWTLSMYETSTDPPEIAIAPLTALPGETIPLALPQ